MYLFRGYNEKWIKKVYHIVDEIGDLFETLLLQKEYLN